MEWMDGLKVVNDKTSNLHMSAECRAREIKTYSKMVQMHQIIMIQNLLKNKTDFKATQLALYLIYIKSLSSAHLHIRSCLTQNKR